MNPEIKLLLTFSIALSSISVLIGIAMTFLVYYFT